MPKTYEPIATQTLGSAAATVTFSSIPSTYTDLVLVVSTQHTAASDLLFRVGNGSIDTGTNYSNTFIYGAATTAASSRATSASSIGIGYTDSTSEFDIVKLNLQNYANTTTNKTILNRSGNASTLVYASVGLWRSTSAINTIQIFPSTGNLNTNSTFSLYGIKAA